MLRECIFARGYPRISSDQFSYHEENLAKSRPEVWICIIVVHPSLVS